MAEYELVRDGECNGHPRYAVIVDGGQVGAIHGYNPTFERSARGLRYVTKRWTSRKRYWRIDGDGGRYAIDYETRRRAAEALIRYRTKTARAN